MKEGKFNKSVIQQAEKLIDEAWTFAPCGSCVQEVIAIQIATWGAEKILENIGLSPNDEYWKDVIEYLKKKKREP